MCAGISNPWQHLGSADRPIRRLLSCLIPVTVDQTARLFVGQWRAPVRSCPVRRKKAEKLPADLLLDFHRAVKSKAGSLVECQSLIPRLCLEGKSSSRGRRRQEERRQWGEDDKKLERRMFTLTLDPEFHFRTFAAKDSPASARVELGVNSRQERGCNPNTRGLFTHPQTQMCMFNSSENK